MQTVKLYYENAYTTDFSAAVLACEQDKKGWQIVLDRTAFFPEGGGQTADTGTLGSVHVLDAHEKQGVVYHLTDGPLPVGCEVQGHIDWPERFRKMQNHSGEHVLSGLVNARYGYDNVGFRLDESGCIVDFSGELTRQQLDELEDAANAVIWDNRPITARFPSEEELRTMEYRSKLDLTENVRIVTVEGVDVCACCAPHVAHTGEIGQLKILDSMRHRGGVRIWIKSGGNALADYRARYTADAEISALLNKPQDAIAAGVKALLEQRDSLRQQLSAAQRQMCELRAASLQPTDGSILLFEDLDNDGMRALVNIGMEKCGGVCAVFSGTDGAWQFVMGSAHTDMRPWLKELSGRLPIRGGGQERMVSGRCTASRQELEAAFAAE